MGFIGKLKNIFYDVEEVEVSDENTSESPAKVEQIMPKREINNKISSTESIKEEKEDNNYSERELFSQKKSFPFPIFDDDEEEEPKPKPKPRNSILDIEPTSATRSVSAPASAPVMSRQPERKQEEYFSQSYSQRVQTKPKESPYKLDASADDKKTFKPTPVISPVYGILDKNYTKEEIKENIHTNRKPQVKNNNVDYVRNKAYGMKNNDLETTLSKINSEVAESVNNLSKEIDNLTENNSDDLSDLLSKIESKKNITIGEAQEMYDDKEYQEAIDKKTSEVEEDKVDNTLEHDLFNLIDSMYDNKEE